MNNAFDYDRAAARIGRNMLWIAAVGALACWVAAGGRWTGGFLLGSAISLVNYRGMRKVVESLGGQSPGRKFTAAGGLRLTLRFALLGGAAYAILRYTSISLLAVLAGLFVLIAAVFVEVAFEIFYAGKRNLDHQDL